MHMSQSDPIATVVITTKNRVEDLCRAIDSVLMQSVPVETIVVDDGSTDGTSDIVSRRFPGVKLIACKESAGLIVRRNEASMLARGEVIFSIDDDAVFSSDRIIEQSLRDFKADERIGAVAIPCIDVLKGDKIRQPVPDGDGVYITSEYIGTAHAVRGDVFRSLGGYRDMLVHQGEERDFCVRMLDAGYVVRLGTADPIHHYESPKRDFRRIDYYGQRNNVLFAWQNAPLAYLPIHLAGTTTKTLLFGWKVGRPLQIARNVGVGYCSIPFHIRSRRPVSRKAWRLSRKLRQLGAVSIEDVVPQLADVKKDAVFAMKRSSQSIENT